MTRIAVGRALISVSDKRGLTPFAAGLVDQGVEIVSSGGTANHLEDAGIPVTRVEKIIITTAKAIADSSRVMSVLRQVSSSITSGSDLSSAGK